MTGETQAVHGIVGPSVARKGTTMSMATLERAVLAGTRDVLNNRKLRMKDILEWSTGEIKPQDGEIMVRVPYPGVNVCVAAVMDKRPNNTPQRMARPSDGATYAGGDGSQED